MNNTCIPLTTNRDITGIGIRVSTYVQSFFILLSAIISWVFTALERDKDALENTHKTAITASITVLSINLSAIIQYCLIDGLSVVDQLVVIMLSLMVMGGRGVAPIPKKSRKTLIILNLLASAFQVSFGFLVWTRKSVLQGIPGDCPAEFIIFGRSVSVTNKSLRDFSIFYFAFGLFMVLLTLLPMLSRTANKEMYESQFNSEFAFLYFVYPFFAVGFWIYVVIATESTLSRNDVAMESNAWSFGQTVAIILILLPIVDFLSVIKQLSQERTPESPSVTGEPGKESKCPRCLQELPTPASP